MTEDPSTYLIEQLKSQGFSLEAGQRRFRLLATHGIPALAATPHGECFSLNILDGELIMTPTEVKHKAAYRMILIERIEPVEEASSGDTPPTGSTSGDSDIIVGESPTNPPPIKDTASLPEQNSFQLV